MSEKLKGLFSKLIDAVDKSCASIHIDFVSHQDAQLDIIKKENKSSDVKNENNKELTSLLADIKSHFKNNGVPLNITLGNPEKNKTIITGLNPDKASLSEAEIALQKMQAQAQKLGAELVLTDRPDIMAEEQWVLPETAPQEGRSADITAGERLAKLAAAIKTVTDKYQLQIELMIRPDLRPQVMMKVSAGETNWIFAAKEGRYPVKDLLAKMAGKTITNGWDAIVVYQRGQANTLLKQQHIKRFITGNTLAPVNEDIDSSTATRLLTHNLTLSAPHLSFNKAGGGDATAQVTMDFIKGMIVYKQKMDNNAYRIIRIEKITPLNSPFVAMDVSLSQAPGSVSDVGEVQFDIREGVHFANNLVVNGMEQETINNFFKQRFDATPENQRIYKLGTISNYEHEQFQPEKFDIRTMGAPNTASRGSQDEGDGAVVLFVQVKDSNTAPGRAEVDWLLTDDYTTALVVSNSMIFDKIIKKNNTISEFFDIHFNDFPKGMAESKAWELVADRGYMYANPVVFKKEVLSDGQIFLCELMFEMHNDLVMDVDTYSPFKIRPGYNDSDGYNVCIDFSRKEKKLKYRIIVEYRSSEGRYQSSSTLYGEVDIALNIKDVFKTSIKNNIIELKYDVDESHVDYDVGDFKYTKGCDRISEGLQNSLIEKYRKKLINDALDGVVHYIDKIKLNSINTFTRHNLLFPENNYVSVKDAHIPGDMLVTGHLGAGSEYFSVTPTETTIAAGSVYQFKTTPEISGVKWSISDFEKGNTNTDLGHIDAATGKYTAPQAETVTEGVRHVVVCAEKGDTKVYARASVVAKGVSVSPAYQVVQPGTSVTLTANSVNGGELKWDMGGNKQGSSLTKVTNNEYTYKAGKKTAKLNVNLERVTVTDEKGASGEALILIPNSSMSGKITVSYDNIPADSVKLVYTVLIKTPELDENGDQIYDEDDNPVFGENEVTLSGSQANWTAVETGGATFDKKTGILTSASGVGDGFAVIRVTYTEGSNQFRSAIVIPLPLSTYQKTILEAYSPER